MSNEKVYLPPTVVGPLSEASRTVTVRGLVTGAQVRLWEETRDAVSAKTIPGGTFVAAWPVQQFRLPDGYTLTPGSQIAASQEDSDPTPDVLTAAVLSNPQSASDIGPVTLVSHLYVGAQSLWVDGAFPGATVMVWAAAAGTSQVALGKIGGGIAVGTPITVNRWLIGSAEAAYGGAARIALSRPVGPSDTIFVQQSVMGFEGPISQQPAPDPLGYSERLGRLDALPTPSVPAPLYVGQIAIRAESLLEGATVSVANSASELVDAGNVDRTGVWLPVPGGTVAAGQAYWVSQAFPSINASSAASPPVVGGGGGDLPPPPIIQGPVCVGDACVVLTGLIFGAEVALLVGTTWTDVTPIGRAVAPGETYAFPLNDVGQFSDLAFEGGPWFIFASQRTALDDDNGFSFGAPQPINTEAYIDQQEPLYSTPPQLEPLLNQGGRAVHITNAPPGCTIQVFSSKLGMIGQGSSSSPWFVDQEGDVPVCPSLIAGDALHLVSFLPADGTMEYPGPSNTATVQALGTSLQLGPVGGLAHSSTSLDILPPILPSPALYIGGGIVVTNVVPGADVDIFEISSAGDPIYSGTAIATLAQFIVPAATPSAGQSIVARQRIFGMTSGTSEESTFLQAGTDPYVLDSDQPTLVGWEIAGDGFVFPQYGNNGCDLGIPVDIYLNGRTYFFFGDTTDAVKSTSPDPNLGFTRKTVGYTEQASPTFPGGYPSIQLNFLQGSDNKLSALLDQNNQVRLKDGGNTPTGVFQYNNVIYVFVNQGVLNDGPTWASYLLQLPADTYPVSDLAGTLVSNQPISSSDTAFKFFFISPTVIESNDPRVAGLLPPLDPLPRFGVLLFGSGPGSNSGYDAAEKAWVMSAQLPRSGNLCLAWMPILDLTPDPTGIWYWAGPKSWSMMESDAAPLLATQNLPGGFGANLSANPPTPGAQDIGEFSVSWDDDLNRWILLWSSTFAAADLPTGLSPPMDYGAGAVIILSAPQPWGPWSDIPTPLDWTDPNNPPGGWGQYLVYNGARDQPPVAPEVYQTWGKGAFNVYAPYVISRYGTWNPWQFTKTIYYTLSTLRQDGADDPAGVGYRVRLASTRLRCRGLLT